MTRPVIRKAEFVLGAAQKRAFPSWDMKEIAIAGRSNVGKSSAVDALLKGRCPVRISKTPGRTRQINFFRITLSDGAFSLVDLPGYGYAKVPLWMREDWGDLVDAYVEQRRQLMAMILILDLRRGPESEEQDLTGWLAEHGVPCYLVATKADKVAKTRQKHLLRKAADELGNLAGRPVLFSARTQMGVEDLWSVIRKILVDEDRSLPSESP